MKEFKLFQVDLECFVGRDNVDYFEEQMTQRNIKFKVIKRYVIGKKLILFIGIKQNFNRFN